MAALGLRPLPESLRDRELMHGVVDNLNLRHRCIFRTFFNSQFWLPFHSKHSPLAVDGREGGQGRVWRTILTCGTGACGCLLLDGRERCTAGGAWLGALCPFPNPLVCPF